MAKAACLACGLFFAPYTSMVMNFVAPSASRIIILAKFRQTSEMALLKLAKSGSWRLIALFLAKPLAIIITLSLVLIQPSMVIILKDLSTASCKAAFRAVYSIAASVVIKQSIVAILGAIIPTPLAIAPIVTIVPPILTLRKNSLGWVSVVIIASAAREPSL